MDRKVLETITKLYKKETSFNSAAVATIISTSGSSPRKAGSQVLFFRDGRVIGTIGGGTGEAEVRQHAIHVMDQGEPAIVDINLTYDASEKEGMVCGGVMKIYIEPAMYSPPQV